MPRPLFVHFGAGNIGRSLVGTVFTQAGYDVLFVDADRRIVQALREKRGYRVVVKDELPPGTPDVVEVRHVDGLLASDAEAVATAVARADLLGTAVGANVLPHVLRSIARGIALRDRPISILLCENLHGVAALARSTLQSALGTAFPLDQRVGFVATSIGKMVPLMPAAVRARDPLEVWGEAYNQIIADGQAFVGPRPELAGLLLKDNFQAYVERKLYVHNLGHAVCACEGFLHGCQFIAEAMGVPAVAEATRAAMDASATALIARYPAEFTVENQAAHVADLLRRFSNRALGDTVFRVGRDLARKLAPDDRFVGALRLVAEFGGDDAAICSAIAAALHFAARDEQGAAFPGDDALRARVANVGPRRFLQEHARLDAVRFDRSLARIEERYGALTEGAAQATTRKVAAS